MLTDTGRVSFAESGPYIYFIVKHSYLYLGETQHLPVIRWGAHCQTEGTFSRLLREIDEDAIHSPRPFVFQSIFVDRIRDKLPEYEWKRATQWIEHDLHLKVCACGEITSKFRLISETVRTAPRRYFCEELPEVSSLAFHLLLNCLREYEANRASSPAFVR